MIKYYGPNPESGKIYGVFYKDRFLKEPRRAGSIRRMLEDGEHNEEERLSLEGQYKEAWIQKAAEREFLCWAIRNVLLIYTLIVVGVLGIVSSIEGARIEIGVVIFCILVVSAIWSNKSARLWDDVAKALKKEPPFYMKTT